MTRNHQQLRVLISLIALCTCLHSYCRAEENARINRISFSGNRVSENTLRKVIPITEGGELTPAKLEETYNSLYAMKLFKSVEISTSSAGAGLADVRIAARDGWFLIPMPFATSGQGGGSAGLMLFSRNVFKRAESVFASLARSDAGGSAAVFLEKDGRSAGITHSERSADEGLYTDGAYSSPQNLRKADSLRYLSGYGTLAALYQRRQQVNSLSTGFPLPRPGNTPALNGRVSYIAEKNSYDNARQQLIGGGRASRVLLELNAGGSREKRDDLGVIFGMGLADMEKRLKDRTQTENRWGAGLSVANAGAWTGSDRAFSKAALSVDHSTVWGGENRLSLKCAAAVSANAPESQLPATGRELGLMGQYAREFRAPRMTSLNVSFSKPLTRSRRGLLQAAFFAETAFDPAAYSATTQKGAGVSLSYRFWRFPLPLGLSSTYSFRDRNFQFSGAIGGRF